MAKIGEENDGMLFDQAGDAVHLVRDLEGGGHLVQHLYDHGEYEPSLGPVVFVEHVYTHATMTIKHGGIERAQKEFDELTAKLCTLRKELHDAGFERSRIIDRLKQMPCLQNIEMLLDGKVTHVVKISAWHGSMEILEKDELREEKKTYGDFRMLSLIGKPRGTDSWSKGDAPDFQFALSSYSDGSGSNDPCWPFTSKEDAYAFAQDRVTNWASIVLPHHTNREDYGLSLGKSAQELGLNVPQDLLDIIEKRATVEKNRKVLEARRNLESSINTAKALGIDPATVVQDDRANAARKAGERA